MVYKREKTSPNHLKRGFSRTTRPTCLIVCEGHTEEQYFGIVRREFTNVTIRRENCPVQIVKYALKEIKDYDSVICVFDKESHSPRMQKFEQAKTTLEKAAKKDKKTIIGAWSIPCFEVWFLLHFDYSDCPFSCCDEVEQALKKKNGFEQYKKSDEDHYQKTRHKIQTAITNATRLYKEAEANNFDRPYTKVHLAVEHLKSLLEA